MSATCPHCGAPLPEGAAFCPHCARPVREKKRPHKPVPLRGKVIAVLVVLALAAAGGLWWQSRHQPQVYEGDGAEVIYTQGDTVYQLTLAWAENPTQPAPRIYFTEQEGGDFTWPSRWFVLYKDNGQNAAEEFIELVESVEAHVELGEAGACPMEAGQPAYNEGTPTAAMVSSIHFICGTDTNRLVWTIHMKNGDTIRLYQNMIVTATETHVYTPEEVDMDTLEQLQALVDGLAQEIPEYDVVQIYLPPVTYDGTLVVDSRNVELYGCTDGSGRTAFTGGIQLRYDGSAISYLYDLDFPGTGEGVGVSSACRAFIIGCTFQNWRTGVLAYGGESWVNTNQCTFQNCQVGLHINSTRSGISDSRFMENVFAGNGTAVVLENVPSTEVLSFLDCQFTGNGTDMDNRCGQYLEISPPLS